MGRSRHVSAGLRSNWKNIGFAPDLYDIDTVPGLLSHPLFFPGRKYTHRPNLGARLKGSSAGRSLLLSGHIDTVPRGSQSGREIRSAGIGKETACIRPGIERHESRASPRIYSCSSVSRQWIWT